MKGFNYENTETVIQKGGKIVRSVTIKKGRGYKSITKYQNGKKIYSVKKPIHKKDIELIGKGKFIPGLFKDCKNCKTKKRRGGDGLTDNDIEDELERLEKGPEIKPIKPYPVPPDPNRFETYERRMRLQSSTPEETSKIFSEPTPEARQDMERREMSWEDTLNVNPFDQEVKIFRGGRRSRRRSRRRRGI
jgi:hypothetical protein